MSYCRDRGSPPAFQDQRAPCGTFPNRTESCGCNRNDGQNTHRILLANLGPSSGGGEPPTGGGGGEPPTGDCHTVPPNHSDYCTSSCRCAEGQGDCDSSAECTGNLMCQQREGVDTCVTRSGGTVPPPQAGCTRPPRVISDGGTGYGACEGDCDRDSDCVGDLVCFQADTGDNIPGCRGRSTNDNDHCVHPSWAVCR